MNAKNHQLEIQEYVGQLEKFCMDFFKKCELQTNQYSTKFILQKIVEEYTDRMDEVSPLVKNLSDETIDTHNLNLAFAGFEKTYLHDNPDLEHLNFVEAKNLAIKTMEFVIDQYRKLTDLVACPESGKIISEIIDAKNRHLKNLKSEYEKVRYK